MYYRYYFKPMLDKINIGSTYITQPNQHKTGLIAIGTTNRNYLKNNLLESAYLDCDCLYGSYHSFTLVDGVWFTRDLNLYGSYVQNMLSITYCPRYVHRFNESIFGGPNVAINPFFGEKPSWVWPAYGKTGGFSEIILLKGSIEREYADAYYESELGDGGGMDRASMSGTRYADNLSFLLSSILDALDNTGFDKVKYNPEGYILGVKHDDMGGITLTFTDESFRYSISCSIIALDSRKNVDSNIRVWGCVWQDPSWYRPSEDRRPPCRHIVDPIIRNLVVNYDIDTYGMSQKDTIAFRDMLIFLVEDMKKIKQEWDSIDKTRVLLSLNATINGM